MRIQEFKIWVKRQLGEDEGCPSVKVELSDKQIEQALQNAFEWFSSHVGFYREASVSLIAGQGEYDLSSISPSVHDVVNAWFPVSISSLDFSVLYPGFLDISGIPLGYADGFSSGMWGDNSYPQTTIVQALQSQGAMEKWLSADLDWEFYRDATQEPVVRIFRVMPVPQYTTGTCIIQYSIDPDEVKLEWFGKKYLYYIKQWALADAKYMLGRKRGKFSSLPTAGGERQLDGNDLINEARDDKRELEEKIMDMDGPAMPLVY
jgi:hypothetical protein